MPRKTKNQPADCWTVYMIQSESGKLYTGITTDLARRFGEHARGPLGARFFRTSAQSRVVYKEACATRGEAARREAAIKRLTRRQKLGLIEG